MLQAVRKQAAGMVYGQLIVVCGLVVVLACLKGFADGLSLLLGGLAAVVPNWYFLWRVFSVGDRSPQQLVRRFFFAEVVKLILSFILVVLVIKFVPARLLAVIAGFIAAYLSVWLVPMLGLFRRKARAK